MPFIAPALLAGGAAALGALITETVVATAFLTAFVSTAAIGAVAMALTKKPKNPEQNPLGQGGGGAVTVRQPIAPWQVVVGRARVGGVLTFRHISTDRRFWHMVITFACHRCQAVDEVWFNDERLTIDPSTGNVFGKYAKTVLTSLSQTEVVGGDNTITTAQTVAGIHDVFLMTGVRNPVRLTEVSAGAINKWDQFSRSGQVFTFHASNSARQARVRYYTASPTSGSWARVKVSLGDEGTSTQPFPDFVAESSGDWSNDHKQYGHTKLYIRLEANNDVWTTGIPQVTIVARGARIFDTRTDTTAFSSNAALWIAHYLTDQDYGLAADVATEIHDDDLVSAANSCDDVVTLDLGGTEARYEVNGAFLTSEQPKAVLERLLAACAGTLVNLGDKWHINVGVYHVPTVTLSEGHLAGPNVVTPMLPTRDDGNANGVKGVFTNPRANWQPDDFPPIASDTYLAEDNNERRWKDLDFTAFVTSFTQAQRLAKIDLLRLRQGLTETATFKIPAWQVVPGRTVARTDAQLGWTAKPFEVLESELAIVEEGDGVTIQTRLTHQETAPQIYDWATSEEQEEDFAPNTALPDPGVVPAPGAPSITEELYETRAGRGVAAKAIVTYTQTVYPFAVRYQLEYKLTAASVYTVLPAVQVSIGSTAPVVQEILDIEPGNYDFRVTAIGGTGARSAYASTLNQEIVGLGAPPAAPTGVSLQIAGGNAIITLDQHPELDVRRGGRILVRHTEATTGQIWEETASIGNQEAWPGDSVVIFLPLKPGTYLLKARDSLGGESASFATAVTKQASVLGFTTLATTIQEDNTFPGSHTNTQVVSNTLRLTEPGGTSVSPSGEYALSAGFDFTTVKRARITGQIEVVVFNAFDLIDSRTDNIDSWLDFDGATGIGSSADVWLEARKTDDNPAGSPTWTAWERLDASEVTCRAMQFRLQMRSFDPTINILVDVLRVKSDEVL